MNPEPAIPQLLHPLHLSEIRSQICWLLDLCALKSCMLVCKDWSLDFARPIWAEFFLDEERTRKVSIEIWLKYHVLVRRLVIREPSVLTVLNYSESSSASAAGGGLPGWVLDPRVHCPNLVQLDILQGHIFQSYHAWTPETLDADCDAEDTKDAVVIGTDEIIAANTIDQAQLMATDRILELLDPQYHPNIRTFSWSVFQEVYNARLWRQLVEVPSRASSLTVLRLSKTRLRVDRLHSIINHCSRLDRIEFNGVNLNFDHLTTNADQLDLGRIRGFTLDRHAASSVPSFGIVGHHLEELSIRNIIGQRLHISSWYCPSLRKASLLGLQKEELGSARLLLQCSGPLQSLELEHCRFGSDPEFIQDVLTRHGSTMKRLSLAKSDGLSSQDLQNLLAGCTQMDEFCGTCEFIDATDIRPVYEVGDHLSTGDRLSTWSPLPPTQIEGLSSWSCLSITRLSVAIRIPLHPDPSKQRFFFEAIYITLSPLIHLESIDLSGGWCDVDRHLYVLGVPWTLESGLNSLQLLSRVKQLVLTGWEDSLQKDDILWMKRYWPNLHLVSSFDERARPWANFCWRLQKYWPECMNIE